MALIVDSKELDTFCLKLFRMLDKLGLLPRQLRAKPNEFEKYPRMLFGCIQRYNDVEAGFKEWESRVLRYAPYKKEEFYPELESLRRWMVQHSTVLSSKINLQHLRTSLYARIFQYLYPRRVMVNAYCVKHQGNLEATDTEFLKQAFPQSIEKEIQELKEIYDDEWQVIVSDVKAYLVANAAYYRKVLTGEEKPALPEDEMMCTTDKELLAKEV